MEILTFVKALGLFWAVEFRLSSGPSRMELTQMVYHVD